MLTDDDILKARTIASANARLIAGIADPEARRRFAAANETLLAAVLSGNAAAQRLAADMETKRRANQALIDGLADAMARRKREREERCSFTLMDLQFLAELDAAFKKDLTEVPVP